MPRVISTAIYVPSSKPSRSRSAAKYAYVASSSPLCAAMSSAYKEPGAGAGGGREAPAAAEGAGGAVAGIGGAGGGAVGASTAYARASTRLIRGAAVSDILTWGPVPLGGNGIGSRCAATDTAMDFPAALARASLFHAAL